jgi:hypothetical protein
MNIFVHVGTTMKKQVIRKLLNHKDDKKKDMAQWK